MAHLIDTMAYTGQTPWHGLGNVLPPQQSLDIWLQAAGMNWTIEQSDVMFNVASDALHIRPYSDSKVLYRSDTLAPLSVVSSRYNVSIHRNSIDTGKMRRSSLDPTFLLA